MATCVSGRETMPDRAQIEESIGVSNPTRIVSGSATPARPRRRIQWRRHLEGYLVIAPWLVGFVALALFPMLASLALAFTKYDIFSPPTWTGLSNFGRLLNDRLFFTVSYNTIYYTGVSVVPRLAISLALALLLNQKLVGIGLFRTAYYLPSVIQAVANVMIWVWIMQPEVGLANYVLRSVGLPGSPWLTDPRTSKISLAIMTFWYFGPQMLVFLAALQSVPTEMHEAAKVDGAGVLRRFWNITVPMITPSIFFNLVVCVIDSLQTFTSPVIATDGGPANSTRTIVMYIYEQAFSNQRMGYASLLAWVLFSAIMVMTAVQFRFSGWVYYESKK